jgi:hypothetical protein
MAAGGAQRQISVGGGIAPRWRSDGRELYFVSGRKMMAVTSEPSGKQGEPVFGAPRELFQEPNLFFVGPSQVEYQPSVSGRQFLVALTVGEAPPTPPLTVVTNWQSAYKKTKN